MSLADLFEELEAAKDSKKARPMEAYMRHQFSFLGIAVPERNKLYKNIYQKRKKQRLSIGILQTLAGKRSLENTNMWLLTI
ncbi:putative DNA alkylation repair enzyme [Streptococcus pneumoniae]|uniref:DNA alkylation repair protein n=1 Tax=Streptococcus pneumoniae TaxID=1313 RepID=UPI0005E5A35D|nr:DNA alkylation repair protein [Streptococcus pneumoniae]CIS73029.1 putative DNA alkylation repair enzyme [Streptococcus pneumoniae]CIT02310.1 putative DNA alkylation repair enzyme [Streptococcus pneumoniae]CIT62525.1 putative DNA alkylation repair enzyme [Streptococcus pneumoniae]CIV47029.1 putative DNA alkylation repair enzyme [Streptococcus pneumoniae]CIW45809.1 putative DNA alkylation repair enzyme [Streptococcus pneumoniae]